MQAVVVIQLALVCSALIMLIYSRAFSRVVEMMPRPPGQLDSPEYMMYKLALAFIVSYATCWPIWEFVRFWWERYQALYPDANVLAASFASQFKDQWPETFQLGSDYYKAPLPPYVFAITTLNENGTRIIVGHGVKVKGYLVTLRHILSQPVQLWATRLCIDGSVVKVENDFPIVQSEWLDLPGALSDVCYLPVPSSFPMKSCSVGRVTLDTQVTTMSSQFPMNASFGKISHWDSFATFRHKASTKPGWSGCPLISNGQVVGIHGGGGCYSNYGYAMKYISMVLDQQEDTDEIALRTVFKKNPWAKYKVNSTHDPDLIEVEVNGDFYRIDVDAWADIEEEHQDRLDRRGRTRRHEYDDYENAPVPPPQKIAAETQTENSPPADLIPEVEDVGSDMEAEEGPSVSTYTISGNVMSPLGGATRADPVTLLKGAAQLVDKAHRSQEKAQTNTAGLSDLQNVLEDRLSAILATVKKQGEELNRLQSENAKLFAQFSRLSTKFASTTIPASTSSVKMAPAESSTSCAASTSADQPEAVNLANTPASEKPSGGTDSPSPIVITSMRSCAQCKRASHVLQSMLAQMEESWVVKFLQAAKLELVRRQQQQ